MRLDVAAAAAAAAIRRRPWGVVCWHQSFPTAFRRWGLITGTECSRCSRGQWHSQIRFFVLDCLQWEQTYISSVVNS